MNKEIEECMKNILKSIEDWEETKILENAKKLNFQLIMLKLLLMPYEFDSLDSFAKYLNETSKFISDNENKEEVTK